MSIDTNLTIKSGRLTRDPEIKTTATGKSVCSFSIACNGFKEKVNFFDCQAWEKTGEIINEHVKKGQKILIIGEDDQQRWDGDDGKKHVRQIINVRSFEFMGGKSEVKSDADKVSDAFSGDPFSDDNIPM